MLSIKMQMTRDSAMAQARCSVLETLLKMHLLYLAMNTGVIDAHWGIVY